MSAAIRPAATWPNGSPDRLAQCARRLGAAASTLPGHNLLFAGSLAGATVGRLTAVRAPQRGRGDVEPDLPGEHAPRIDDRRDRAPAEALHLLVGQAQAGRGQEVLELVERARADDRSDHPGPRQQPRQRDLGDGRAARGGDGARLVDRAEVALDAAAVRASSRSSSRRRCACRAAGRRHGGSGRSGTPRPAVPRAARPRRRRGRTGASRSPSSARRASTAAAATRTRSPPGPAPRPTTRAATREVRGTQRADLAGPHEPVERLERLVDGRPRIRSVNLVEIDGLDAQPTQRASQAARMRAGASPAPPGSVVPGERIFVATTTASRRRASHGASVRSDAPSAYASAVSTSVPPASRKASSRRWASATGVRSPMSIVPSARGPTAKGPSAVRSMAACLPVAVRHEPARALGLPLDDPARRARPPGPRLRRPGACAVPASMRA